MLLANDTTEAGQYYRRLIDTLRDQSMTQERLARRAEKEGAPFRAKLAWDRAARLLKKRDVIIDAVCSLEREDG